MKIIPTIRRAPQGFARRIGAAGLGIALAATLMLPGTSLAAPRLAPQDSPCPQPVTVQCVITFGNGEIAKRIASLNTLSGKATAQLNANHINSTQAGVITGDVSTNESGLQALQTKLDAETTLASARADVLSIYTQFRVYIVVLPRDYHEIWLDILTNVQVTMAGKATTIQNAINAASALKDNDNDGDIATLDAAFSDYQAQLGAATGQINIANGLLPEFTPQNYDANPGGYKGDWTTFHGDIKAAHSDILAAAADLHKIAKVLKELINEQHLAPGATDTNEP